MTDDLKTFGYHPGQAYGSDIWFTRSLKNVNVELEYNSVGQVCGVFIREAKTDD